ncbi:MAG: ribonucleotide-diphosphate reductase subunit alpha, partial [alpha proteobacterium MED-G10]
DLWQKILETRMQTGEPYLVFIDTVNKNMAKHQKSKGLKVKTSNLCSEIMLHTGLDHLGKERTAVCCLSSVNLEKWDEWSTDTNFIQDVMRFLDNVLEDFIENAPESMKNAVYSAKRERSVGLGAMGFHSFLQKKGIPFESALAKSWNTKFFRHLKQEADKASVILAIEKGACPDADEMDVKARFSHKLAIAPTASISIICGGTSACVEPIPANIYTHKTLSGSFTVKNKYLERILEEKNINNEKTWQSIIENDGSISHLKELSEDEKKCFKTAFEIDQRWIIEMAADRTPFICQSQSINLYLSADIDKWDLMMLHWKAWELGIKSLYYCRSKSIQRASYAGVEADNTKNWPEKNISDSKTDYEECLSCQ